MDDNWSQCLQKLESSANAEHESIAFSHDSALIIQGGFDGALRIWRVATGEQLQKLEGHKHWVLSVAFSYNSALIASASRDETVRIWRTATGECVRTLRAREAWWGRKAWWATSVAFSRDDSTLLASSFSNGTVWVWRAATGECIFKLEGHLNGARSVAFSHDSVFIASGGADGTVRVWRTCTGECVQTLTCDAPVESAAFSHDSKLIASASGDAISLWRATAIDEWTRDRTLASDGNYIRSVAFSKDSDLILSSSASLIRIWRASTGECVQRLACDDGVETAVFSHDSSLIAIACISPSVQIWRTEPSKRMHTVQRHRAKVTFVAISPDETMVASSSADLTIYIWHAGTGECIELPQGPFDPVEKGHFRAVLSHTGRSATIRHPGECYLVAFSHDSTRLAAVIDCFDDVDSVSPSFEKYEVRIWSASTGECIETSRVLSGSRTYPLAFSLDLSLLAFIDPGRIEIYSVSKRKLLQRLEYESGTSSPPFDFEALEFPEEHERGIGFWRRATGECVEAYDLGFILDELACKNPATNDRITSHNSGSFSATGPVNACTSAFGIRLNDCWVTWNGERLLWLPPDYRPCSAARVSSTFCFGGGRSGKVIMIGFSQDEASKAFADSRG